MAVTFPEPDGPVGHSISPARCEQGTLEEALGLLASKALADWAGGVPGRDITLVDPSVDGVLVSSHGQCAAVQFKHFGSEAARRFANLANGFTAAGLADHAGRRWQLQVVPASRATEFAREVRTQEGMGAALRVLREEAGLTISQLTATLEPLNIAGLRRSTIGRVCVGGSLCATREALEALVKVCGVPDSDVEVWVGAWERARASQRPRGRRPVDAGTRPVETSVGGSNLASTPETTEVWSEPGGEVVEGVLDEGRGVGLGEEMAVLEGDLDSDDEVLGTWTVTFTRGHVRTAVVLAALFGLAATTSSAEGVRSAGAVVLGVAASVAMFEMIRAGTVAATVASAAA